MRPEAAVFEILLRKNVPKIHINTTVSDTVILGTFLDLSVADVCCGPHASKYPINAMYIIIYAFALRPDVYDWTAVSVYYNNITVPQPGYTASV